MDPTKDFISVGFGITGTDNIYIGASGFTPNGIATQIVAQGIITVVDTNNTYQLVNLGKTKLRLEAPHIENLNTGSYFVNSVVTIIVEYLGVAPDNP